MAVDCAACGQMPIGRRLKPMALAMAIQMHLTLMLMLMVITSLFKVVTIRASISL